MSVQVCNYIAHTCHVLYHLYMVQQATRGSECKVNVKNMF